MKRIMVAIDGSDAGTAALKEAVDLAAINGAELIVLTVAPRPIAPNAASDELAEYARVEHLAGGDAEVRSIFADDILAKAKAIVEEQRYIRATYIERTGDPADEILSCARARAADMLVIGTRGRGPLAALLQGSVSRTAAASAGCPVIIVPAPGS